ncbi:MAG: transposase [Dokdonella sp.]
MAVVAKLLRMTPAKYPLKGKARLRLGRHSDAGRIYFVTFGTAARRGVFGEWETARIAAEVLSKAAFWHDSRLLCWVLMPDHWHGLIDLGTRDSLSDLVRRLKGRVARAVNQARGSSGPVWASGFYDHALRREDELMDIARYVVLNPVRAGLVPRVGLYPFWNAVWLEQHRG